MSIYGEPLTIPEERALLEEREWLWKEGWRVYCPTCGAEYKDSTLRRSHRRGCSYDILLRYYRRLAPSDGNKRLPLTRGPKPSP